MVDMNSILKKIVTIFIILIIGISCNESDLSHGKIDSLSLIRAEINISQSLRDQDDNQIVVSLFDEHGKTIRNDSLKIYVNGADVKYTVRKELYYTSTSYYLKDNATPQDNRFIFEIALSDGKRIFLAEAKALSPVNAQNIIYSEKGDLNRDVEVKWKDLEGVNYLEISRSLKVKKKEEPNVTTYEERAPDTIKINSTGNYIIAKSTFENAQYQLSALSFKFIAQKTGNMNPQLGKGSSINIQGNIERRIWFK